MVRTLMCLPLCLILAPSYPAETLALTGPESVRVFVTGPAVTDGLPDPAKDILGFLEACLKRYDEKVKAYTLNFHKQERTLGTLHPWETIEVCYQDQPHRVFFDWQEGGRKPGAIKALYAEGENKNGTTGKSQIVALTNLGVTLNTDPDSNDSKRSARYPLSEFGLKQAMQRVLEVWKAADKEKNLHVEYLGLHTLPKADGQICHKIHRHSFARPEGEDGVNDVILYIDRETLFQVGTILKGKDGELLGEYYFRNIQLNPTFGPEQFTKAMLKAKR
ncbi:MAG TPA: DUF1571 domain-containing protein [Gemmataceae bacterium]|nr:DUF1571 domain-containing protein [Gemmataceae bacterium]